jgi:glucose/mannose-6-phosphate isomerase
MRRLGPAFELWDEVYEVFELLESLNRHLKPETPTAFNPAKKLALGLSGKIPFVYGPKQFDAVAYRFKTQFNENSKIPAASGFFPEAFHNSVMGCEGPEEVRNSTCALIIRDPDGSPEMVRKTEVFKELLESSGIRVLELYAQGKGMLARIFSTIYIGDYASTYLGLLYGLDPGSTDSINALKKG